MPTGLNAGRSVPIYPLYHYQAVRNMLYADVSVILRTHTGGVFKEYNEEVTTAAGVTGTDFSCACKILT